MNSADLRPPRWRLAAVCAAAAILTLAGCAGSDASTVADTTTPAPSNHEYLITAEGIRPLISFGHDLREVPDGDAVAVDPASVHGPCGATIAADFGAPGDSRAFQSSAVSITEAVSEPDVPAGDLIGSVDADATKGCASFTETHNGVDYIVRFDRPLASWELPTGAAGPQTGWLQTLTAPDGISSGRAVVLAAASPRVVLLVLTDAQQPNTTQLAGLVSAAVAAA